MIYKQSINRILFSFLFLFILLSASGCNLFRASRMSESTFIKYYIDFVALQDSLGRDKVNTEKIIEVLDKKYDVTKEQYIATINYYSKESVRWEEFFDKVLAELKKREKVSSKKL